MHRADRHEYGQHRSAGNSNEPNPTPAPRSALPVASKSAGNRREIWYLPAGDVERRTYRVRIGVDRRERLIEFEADPRRGPVEDSSDLRVRDTLETAEHDRGTL